MLQNVLQTVLLFFVLVSIHEWGHLYFAKRAGILVREFAIGFGPKVLSFVRGETRYTLRLLPIGGFVRMAGEDPEIVSINPGQRVAVTVLDDKVTHIYLNDYESRSEIIEGVVEQIDLERSLFIRLDADGEMLRYTIHPQAMLVSKGVETQIAPWDRQFGSKSVGQRMMAIFAGPLMNFLLALVLFISVVFMTGVPSKIQISQVLSGQPAAAAGLVAGDVIVTVDGEPIGGDGTKLTSMIKASANEPMVWVVERSGEQVRIEVTPKETDGNVLIGVMLGPAEMRSATVTEAVKGGWSNVSSATVSILDSFGKLVTLQFKMDDLAGPIGIVEFTTEQVQAGWPQYIFWMALFSLYLGLFNLLPFPALDGSRLVFLLLEAVRGKPVDPNRESMVHFIGFAMLMLLMIAVTYNDILKLIKG